MSRNICPGSRFFSVRHGRRPCRERENAKTGRAWNRTAIPTKRRFAGTAKGGYIHSEEKNDAYDPGGASGPGDDRLRRAERDACGDDDRCCGDDDRSGNDGNDGNEDSSNQGSTSKIVF